LFGVLTLADAALSAQDALQESWQGMGARLGEQARTRVSSVEAHTGDIGTSIELTLQNSGDMRLVDFDQWDVVLEYYDDNNLPAYHIAWLPYIKSNPAGNQWTVAGIYGSSGEAAEIFEPGVLNPREEIVLHLKVSPPVGQGAAVQATISTGNGAGTSIIFTGNMLPVLEINAGIVLASGGTKTIDAALLKSTDADDPPPGLNYTVTTPPSQGSLNLGNTFTQADIDSSLLSYTHAGSGSDSFQFTISDGKDTFGPYTFAITISLPPVLSVNAGLTVTGGGTGAITSAFLQTTDEDDPTSSLQYTVTTPPTQGSLNLGNAFTQDDIDNGLLAYANTGSGSDSFQFTVSDGETIIGPYTFTISAQGG
jgi:hypothetical protein